MKEYFNKTTNTKKKGVDERKLNNIFNELRYGCLKNSTVIAIFFWKTVQ